MCLFYGFFFLILKLIHNQYIKVEMATPSSNRAGTIPGTEQLGGLQSIGILMEPEHERTLLAWVFSSTTSGESQVLLLLAINL